MVSDCNSAFGWNLLQLNSGDLAAHLPNKRYVRRSLQRQGNAGESRFDAIALPRTDAFPKHQRQPPAPGERIGHTNL
ncbi:hypothetical protein D3C71_1963910 [compost metagenome]